MKNLAPFLGENIWMTRQQGLTADELGTGAGTGWYREIDTYKYPDDPTESWSSCVDWTKVGHFTQVREREETENYFLHFDSNSTSDCGKRV